MSFKMKVTQSTTKALITNHRIFKVIHLKLVSFSTYLFLLVWDFYVRYIWYAVFKVDAHKVHKAHTGPPHLLATKR
jgi:hypothetical protein